MRLLLAGVVLGFLVQPALAFQENTVGGAEQPAAPSLEAAKPSVEPAEAGKGLTLSVPEVTLGTGSGTEVRIPGLGKVGVLPKLDFGLELLYGATDEQKGMPEKNSDSGDVSIQLRGKYRFKQ
jgi:hypothetical protein